jgi:hypothetical protein
MNEQIRQLAEQVGAVRNVLAMGRHDGVLFTESELEKFAELIVQECANFLKDTMDDHFAAEQLEEHFGVEE